MGVSSHPVEHFGAPFLLVDETVFIVPAGSLMRLSRQHFKVLFVLGGSVRHRVDGRPEEREVVEGDILVVPSVRQHLYLNPSTRREARVHVVRLFLDLETRERGPGRNGVAEFREFVKRAFPEPVHLGSGIDAEVRERLAVLRREGDDREPGYEHRVRAVCTDLMVLLARRAAPRPHARRKGGVPPVVAQAMEFIQKHHADPGLRLGAIAWHVGRAEEHLARLFRRDTGRSVFDHVRELRIHRARTLLRDPALSVTTVAERCGFSSLAFFSRTFRKLTGVTPSAYRAGLDVRLQTAPVPERYAIRSRA